MKTKAQIFHDIGFNTNDLINRLNKQVTEKYELAIVFGLLHHDKEPVLNAIKEIARDVVGCSTDGEVSSRKDLPFSDDSVSILFLKGVLWRMTYRCFYMFEK